MEYWDVPSLGITCFVFNEQLTQTALTSTHSTQVNNSIGELVLKLLSKIPVERYQHKISVHIASCFYPDTLGSIYIFKPQWSCLAHIY